jgi:hypothetical protein
MKTITNFVIRAISFCLRYAYWVIAASIVLGGLSTWYAATHFSMTTDITQLISGNNPARQREEAYEKAFPQFDTIIAVINAPTPELAGQAATALSARLAEQKQRFRSVEEPGRGEFFSQNGLLFLPADQLTQQMKLMSQAQRLINALSSDPSLRGVIRAFQFALLGVQSGKLGLDELTWPMTQASGTLEDVIAGKPASFSWQVLTQGHEAAPNDLMRFLRIQAVLNYSELEPGQQATETIRKEAAALDLAGKYQARVRLTGPVPMNDDQFATIKENAALNAAITIAVVLFIMWLALRWLRIIFAVFVALVVGLAVTAAVGLLLVGTLNLISVYFAVLFVGLGVDFGIQFSVRYRAERHEVDGLREALLHAGRRAGAPLTLAALATAAGFLAFLPTAYRGLSELGLIAGLGMLIAFITSITVLPALLGVLKPRAEPHPLGYQFLAPVDEFLEKHRTPILIGTIAVILAASPLLYWLRFDFNPMNLRNRNVESVATYLELDKSAKAGTSDIVALEPSVAKAEEVAQKIRALPQVERVTTLSTFVPEDQDKKLPAIKETAEALESALYPQKPVAPPTDADNVAAINSAIDVLGKLTGSAAGRGADAARRLIGDLATLAKADPSVRARAQLAFVQPLRSALDDLRHLLKAREVTRANLPADISSQWVTPDGRARIEITPRGESSDNTAMRDFAIAVQKIEPEATEGPISILEARRIIITAFLEAGAFALLSIAILLWITLRRSVDVLLTLVPLLVAGLVTLEICVAIDLPLNFANIIALPLLLGVGVAFKIYYIMAWREGQTRLLQSVLTRAVTFSACTTATAFGSLYFSSDPATSSMGKLLALSLLTTMMAAAVFQPILMGKPRDEALEHKPKPGT